MKDHHNYDRVARLRQAWTKQIRPEDYDAHMSQVGQAQANAQLLVDWLRSNPPRPGSSILFAGAGTGQMFDFLSPEVLSPYRITFTDINLDYLKLLESRLKSKTQLRYEIVLDDIERPQLSARYALAVAILLLEHVDWRLAVAALCALSLENILVVIQENPRKSTIAVGEGQPLIGTMRVFREVHPILVNKDELVQEFSHHEFRLVSSRVRRVLDEKKMVGLGFVKNWRMRGSTRERRNDLKCAETEVGT